MRIYDIKVTKRESGQDVETTLSEFEGKVLLIVNTATGCGLTPQYEALEQLYRRHKDEGFVVLDFPCNQFFSDEESASFCTVKYDTTFPRFKKIAVNGPDESPLYTFLKDAINKREGQGKGLMAMMIALSSRINGKSKEERDIKWNFTKFLVDRAGNVVYRFEPTATAEQMIPIIQEILNK